jgi:GNAT superfamily N-acetyltransferase
MSEEHRGGTPSRGVLAAVLRRLPKVERLYVYKAPVSAEGLDAVTSRGFELIDASDDLLDLLEGVRQRHQVDPLRALLKRGVPGWFAMKDGRFAGHAFLVASRDAPERFGGVWLYPGEMAITSLFVAPAFRGAGLGGALHRQLVAEAVRAYGSFSNIAWTADYNLASQRMLARHGCVRIGTLTRLIAWYRPLVSTYRGAPPRR